MEADRSPASVHLGTQAGLGEAGGVSPQVAGGVRPWDPDRDLASTSGRGDVLLFKPPACGTLFWKPWGSDMLRDTAALESQEGKPAGQRCWSPRVSHFPSWELPEVTFQRGTCARVSLRDNPRLQAAASLQTCRAGARAPRRFSGCCSIAHSAPESAPTLTAPHPSCSSSRSRPSLRLWEARKATLHSQAVVRLKPEEHPESLSGAL